MFFVDSRIVVAPMAGGPTTAGLVTAAAQGGAIGFLAAGYKLPSAVSQEVEQMRAAGVPYGLNIFVPVPPPADPEPLVRYRNSLKAEATRYDVSLPPVRLDDDDHFAAKIDDRDRRGHSRGELRLRCPGPGGRAGSCGRPARRCGHRDQRGRGSRGIAAGPDALIAQGGPAGGDASTTRPAILAATRRPSTSSAR